MKVDSRLKSVPVMHRQRSIDRRTTIQDSNFTKRALNQGYFLSFTANPVKNSAQLVSIAPECQGVLNAVYKVGGLGNVAGEASVAFADNGGMDVRTIIPYYAPDNKESGGIKIKTPIFNEKGEQEFWEVQKIAGNTPSLEGGNVVTEKVPAYKFISVSPDYTLKEGEQFVIHEPVVKDKPWTTSYRVLEDTGISGSVKSISDDLEGIKVTPYKVFKLQGTDVGKAGNPPVYILHTPELAKFKKAYIYEGGTFSDALYGIFSKATVDALPKLNDEKFGNFNPANLWFHDRQAFISAVEISEKSALGDEYWKGIKAHSTYHNPGADYQGHYVNPIDFMRIVGTEQDLEELKKNPDDFAFVKSMFIKVETERGKEGGKFASEEILTKDELAKLNEIFKPLYGNFIDERGEYNLCKIPVESVRKNPFNFSAGTVSKTFGEEMKNPNTKEITYGLTKDFASIPMVNIVNGSSASSMHLDEIGSFGKHNRFTEKAKDPINGFTPITKDIVSDTDLLFKTNQKNKKWFINNVWEATKGETESLKSLFFNKDQIENGATVLGGLSKYKEGDILFIGWGRADEQKGFPTSLGGALDFYKNKNIPEETKKRVKFVFGGGPWKEKAKDWELIQAQMKELQELDGGKYKYNVCYVNGFFSNRFVVCADYSLITSRFEPCGITPLESYAGGTPVISIKTGGSPDFIVPYEEGKAITNETGFLTKNAFLVNPEVIGAQKGLKGAELDAARIDALAKETSECIEKAVDLVQNHPEEYKKMMKNAINSKIGWHENAAFNGGLSAIECYKKYAWSIGPDNKVIAGQEINNLPLENLKGQIPLKTTVEGNPKNAASLTGSAKDLGNSILSMIKSHKVLAAVGTAVAGFIAIAAIIKNKSKNAAKISMGTAALNNDTAIFSKAKFDSNNSTLSGMSFDKFVLATGK